MPFSEETKKKITKSKYIFVLMCLIIMLFRENILEYVYGIDSDCDDCDQDEINNEVKKIIKNKKQKTVHKLINASTEGVMKGCIMGGITGGLPGAITGGATYGIANPVITYVMKRYNKE